MLAAGVRSASMSRCNTAVGGGVGHAGHEINERDGGAEDHIQHGHGELTAWMGALCEPLAGGDGTGRGQDGHGCVGFCGNELELYEPSGLCVCRVELVGCGAGIGTFYGPSHKHS